VFGKQALLKLPATCQVNMKDFKSYTPHSGKPSIAAAAALVHLNTTGQLDKAGEMWHAVTLMPHSLVRNLNQVFLVIAQGRFGAQAWPAEKVCPTSASQGGQRRWGFKTSCNFVWIFTESLSNWFFIDFEWEINNCQVMDFGFLVAREKYADDMPMSISLTSGDENRSHVPVLAEALVTQGRYRLTKHDRNALCHDGTSKPKNLAAGKDEEVKMLEKLLHNHASLPQYLKRLDHWHTMEAAKNKRRQHKAMQKANKPGEESNEDIGNNGTSSESDSGDDNKATCYAFTCAALQEMDDTNMFARNERVATKKQPASTSLPTACI